MIKVNKQSIDILSNSRLGSSRRNKINMTMDASSVCSSKNHEEARLLDVIKMLNNQNGDLMKELESVKQLNEELNTKVLLITIRFCCWNRSQMHLRAMNSVLLCK
jgi:hypothetical protein